MYLDTHNEELETRSAEPAKKKPKQIPKIFDGKYYTIRNESGDNIEAICTVCKEVRKGNYFSTGNFFCHYKIKHSSMVDDMKLHTKSEIVKKKLSNQPSLHENESASPENVCLYFNRF